MKTCETCRFWRRRGHHDSGACHRYPPVPTRGCKDPVFIWPTTGHDKGCGEHRPRREPDHD